MTFELNLDQLRTQAKERVRERRAGAQEVKLAEVQFELAHELGFSSWRELHRQVQAMQSQVQPPTPVVLSYRAIDANDRAHLRGLLDRFPDLVVQRATNGNDLLGMAGKGLARMMLDAGRVRTCSRAATAGPRSSWRCSGASARSRTCWVGNPPIPVSPQGSATSS